MLKILDANPLLIKSLGCFLGLNPLLEHIICKNWGWIDFINKKKKLVLDVIGTIPNHNNHHKKY